MKKNIILLAAFALFISAQSFAQKAIKPSGKIITKDFDFSGFSRIEIANDFKAYVNFSKKNENVSIEADDNLQEHVYVEVKGNTLRIGLKNNVNIRGKETLVAYISAEMINSFKASDDAIILLKDKLETDDVSVDLSSDSKFGGELAVIDLDLKLRSDSEMKIEGSAHNVSANLKGDSILESFDFEISKLDIDLFGDSEAYVRIMKKLNVKAFGDSVLYYKGGDVIERKILLGDSELIKMD